MRTIRVLLAHLCLLMLVACYPLQPLDVAVDMQGNWQGIAEIVVSWCEQDTLAVVLHINADGSVMGMVGEASLSNGFLSKNRGALGRWLNVATDYRVVANLDGLIVAAEGIQRDSISMPLNFNGEMFTGGLHTSGTSFGGAESMFLTATNLQLTRIQQ